MTWLVRLLDGIGSVLFPPRAVLLRQERTRVIGSDAWYRWGQARSDAQAGLVTGARARTREARR
jgi:hypothetical protein